MELVLLEDQYASVPVHVFVPGGATRKGGVIFYMDAFGLRPEIYRMAQRYADHGYVLFLPDLYHRLELRHFAIPRSKDEPLDPMVIAANNSTSLSMSIADSATILSHAAAYGIGRLGAVGYCMGARHALAAAAAYPNQISACACLHGGQLVCEGTSSPHTLIPRVSGGLYFAFAENDDACPEVHKRLIEKALSASCSRGRVEHFAAAHGWTFPERWCYDATLAERAFGDVMRLFDEEVAATR